MDEQEKRREIGKGEKRKKEKKKNERREKNNTQCALVFSVRSEHLPLPEQTEQTLI